MAEGSGEGKGGGGAGQAHRAAAQRGRRHGGHHLRRHAARHPAAAIAGTQGPLRRLPVSIGACNCPTGRGHSRYLATSCLDAHQDNVTDSSERPLLALAPCVTLPVDMVPACRLLVEARGGRQAQVGDGRGQRAHGGTAEGAGRRLRRHRLMHTVCFVREVCVVAL